MGSIFDGRYVYFCPMRNSSTYHGEVLRYDTRATFDEIAELYDAARSGYPEPLIDGILALARVPSRGRILEIGCGTGLLLARVAPDCERYLGTDFSPTALEGIDPSQLIFAGEPMVRARYPNVWHDDMPVHVLAYDTVVSRMRLGDLVAVYYPSTQRHRARSERFLGLSRVVGLRRAHDMLEPI